MDFIKYISDNYGEILGVISAFVLFFDRLAKVTPTEWDNKFLEKVSKVLYKIFAIAGVKVPDIQKIEDGTIVEKK